MLGSWSRPQPPSEAAAPETVAKGDDEAAPHNADEPPAKVVALEGPPAASAPPVSLGLFSSYFVRSTPVPSEPPKTMQAEDNKQPVTATGAAAGATLAATTAPPVRPGKPVALKRSDTSITIAWPATSFWVEEPDSTYLTREDFDTGGLEYQVRFWRSDTRLGAWNTAPDTTTTLHMQINGLASEAPYVFQVRARTSPTVKWTTCPLSESSAPVFTLSDDEEKRIANLERVTTFIKGAAGLDRYLEDAEKPDSAVDKTSRAFEGILSSVSSTGVGGVYMQVVKNAWRLHKTGLMSLIFDEALQKTVMVLLRFLNIVSAEIGLSTRDVAVGSYFALWASKRERLLHPEAEFEEHAQGQPGVLVSEAPEALLDECMYYFSFAGFVYRDTPAQVQWVLDRFPYKGGGFRLVAQRLKPDKFKPAFFLAAHEELRTAVFAICGTNHNDDIVTDSLCEVGTTRFHTADDQVTDYAVHAGMNQAADWLVRGDTRHRTTLVPGNDDEGDEHAQPHGGGVGAAVGKLWAAGYRRVVFVGHSMGAGVAVLAALKVANRIKDLEVSVYGYGIPACVDERLAEALKGKRADPSSTISWLGTRVTCKSVIRHDDLVPRLSILTAREFALDLQSTRSRWGPLLNEDIASFTSRLKTVWAPTQRAHAMSRGGPTERVPTERPLIEPKAVAVDLITLEPLKRSLIHRLVPPGIMVHTYMHNGCHRASVVDFRFAGLRRIAAFPDCIEDHRFWAILSAVRGVRASNEARKQGRAPPSWESLRDHADDAQPWQVRCRVCTFPVSWHHTSSSEAFEVRATFHCYACGNVVCSKCSEQKLALPSYGILDPVRVCDACVLKCGVVEPHGEREMALKMANEGW